MASMGNAEVYLNSFINLGQYPVTYTGGAGTNDLRCNVLIQAGSTARTDPSSSTVIGDNAFYGTTPVSANASGTDVTPPTETRVSAKRYEVGQVLTTAGACRNVGDSACYMYKVAQAGTTASSPSVYCADLGCTTNDGSVAVQAIRGPHVFYRKLRSAPEPFVIPYARPHAAAPDAYTCPPTFASRPDVGINEGL